MSHSLLLVDDEENILKSLLRLLRNEGYRIFTAMNGQEGLRAIEENDISLVISDNVMPGMRGIDFLVKVKEASPATIRIMLTGRADVELAIDAINRGEVYRFITKPWDGEALLQTIKESLDCRDLAFDSKGAAAPERRAARPASGMEVLPGVVGRSPKMLDAFNFIRRIAPYYRSVVITGETGTGKEVLAKALHAESPAAKGPFVPCNCTSLVETLIESELFGHKKGAFTGAIADKAGLFEAAGEGTIFLDEIGDIPALFQPRLLRVLQDGEFRPVGSNRPMKAKCRVIAASNKDLATEVREGRFRDDLFYRLAPLVIHVPPLRERKDDIPELCRHIMRKFTGETGKKISGMTPPAEAVLMSHDWPGNVRELENVIEQAGILTTGPLIREEDIPAFVRRAGGTGRREPADLDSSIREHIGEVLRKCNGNRTHAAKALGISRRALLRRIEKYSIE